MQINKNIKKVVGGYLESVGFEFRGEKEYKAPALCRFTRQYGEKQQIVTIAKSRLDTSVGFALATDAWGYPQAGARDLIPETAIVMEEIKKRPLEDRLKPYPPEMYAAIDACAYHINQHADWLYEDEEGLKNALMEIRDVIETYGLAWLDEMCIESKFLPTNEMGTKLYQSHEVLCESFIKKHQIDPKTIATFDPDTILGAVRSSIKSIEGQPYLQVQDDLVEMAAFLGEQMRKELGGEWENCHPMRMVRIVEMKGYIVTSCYPLADIVDAWRTQDTCFLETEYQIMLDSKPPLSTEQMLEIQRRLKNNWKNGVPVNKRWVDTE